MWKETGGVNMITLISSLLSGIFATIITLVWTWRNARKDKRYDYKLSVFKDLMAYRNDITEKASSSGVFESAINQVFVAYNDCPDVLEKFEVFRKMLSNNNKEKGEIVIADLLQLLKSMAKELKIDYSFSNDDLFSNPIQIKE